jgi:hypothetical protein
MGRHRRPRQMALKETPLENTPPSVQSQSSINLQETIAHVQGKASSRRRVCEGFARRAMSLRRSARRSPC